MRESPMAKQFKGLLPEELQKIAHISFSNQDLWGIASEHLQTLYGKYANPQFCIEHYYQSNEYKIIGRLLSVVRISRKLRWTISMGC